MKNNTPRPGRWWRVGMAAGLGLPLLTVVALIVLGGVPMAHAQADPLGLEISKTLEGDSTVQVGQVLTFNIRIANTGALTITQLALVDTFDPAVVAPAGQPPYGKPDDPPFSDPPGVLSGADTITWDNILAGREALGPGEQLEIKVRLRAVHPTADLAVVNRARIAEAISDSGQQGGGGQSEAKGRSKGGTTPVFKKLGTDGPISVGMPVTYIIYVTNQGAADVTTIPLKDTFDGTALRFVSADPPPSGIGELDAGGNITLEWSNLLANGAVLRPGERIQITTVFTALKTSEGSTNRAEVSGARDEYGNDLELQRAEAPIRVVPGAQQPTAAQPTAAQPTAAQPTAAQPTTAQPTTEQPTTEQPTAVQPTGRQPTSTAKPESRKKPRDEEETPQPSATATSTSEAPSAATLVATSAPEAASAAPTDTAIAATETSAAAATTSPEQPKTLPNTGAPGGSGQLLPFTLILIVAGLLLVRGRVRR